jgi:hypothetical protein
MNARLVSGRLAAVSATVAYGCWAGVRWEKQLQEPKRREWKHQALRFVLSIVFSVAVLTALISTVHIFWPSYVYGGS